MAYNNNWKGKKKKGNFQKKERPRLPIEHELDPFVELAIDNKADFGDYRTTNSVCKDTMVFDADRRQRTLPVTVAAAMAYNQMGIPYNHDNMPNFRKIPTDKPSCAYSAIYSEPIVWQKSDEFRHIPCFTRYVIDTYGRVLNAYNGRPVAMEYGGYKLVPDGPSNKTRSVHLHQLMLMSFTALPEDFVDYGFGNYSHELAYSPETGKIEFLLKPEIAVKNTDDGSVTRYRCIDEFMKSAEFEYLREIGQAIRENHYAGRTFIDGTLKVGPYMIKEVTERSMPELPSIPVNDLDEPAGQSSSSNDGFDDGGFGDDDDIPF